MNKQEKLFHLVYITEEDIKNETKKLISEITEDKISAFSFKGESFYNTGHGHNFVYGFYNEYITKTEEGRVLGYFKVYDDETIEFVDETK